MFKLDFVTVTWSAGTRTFGLNRAANIMPDVSINDNLQYRKHITGGMRMTNVGDNPQLVLRKVAPPLEVVTHGGLNGKLSLGEFYRS